MLNVEK